MCPKSHDANSYMERDRVLEWMRRRDGRANRRRSIEHSRSVDELGEYIYGGGQKTLAEVLGEYMTQEEVEQIIDSNLDCIVDSEQAIVHGIVKIERRDNRHTRR